MQVSFLAYSSKTEATYSSESSADFQRTARRYIPEDRTRHNLSCENLKSSYSCNIRHKTFDLYEYV
jgi:hypothetical protein